MDRITADLLIPGTGTPIRGGVVDFDGATITYAGPAADAPQDAPDRQLHTAVVMPGMWDCHTHLMGTHSWDLSTMFREPPELRAVRCVGDLKAALDAGITSVREVGGLGIHLARAVNEGSIEGPQVYAAGELLSTTGGHGDSHAYPLEWVHAAAGRDSSRLADGRDDCMRAVREQLRRDAKVIKICASGGVLSEVDHPVHQQFTLEEMKAIVEVAGMADRAVAAHCHGKPGMLAALEAGVTTIEHGTYLDEEVCDAMAETGAILVPTRTIIENILSAPEGAVPAFAMTKMLAAADVHAAAIALAHEHGVRIAMGTDIAMSGPGRSNAWGTHGMELPLLAKLGLSPLEAIEAATATAPATLGPQAPTSGRLAAGYDADLITLDADPLTSIEVLADPAHITGVWKRGRAVKATTTRS